MKRLNLTRVALRHTYLVALLLLIIAVLVNYALQPNLFLPRVLNQNLRLFLPLMLVAAGQTIVIIGGGIDLSAGAIVSMVNAILVTRMTASSTPEEVILTVALGLFAGLLAGAFNGLCVAYLRLQPIVTTYATSFVFFGVTMLILPRPGGEVQEQFLDLYRSAVADIPFAAFMIGLLVVAWLLIRGTRYSQYLYATGGNADAAYATGVPVNRVRFSTYVWAGFFAALGGLALALVTGSGAPRSGESMTLDSVVAVVLGGTRLSGGQGGVVGSILGVAILSIVRNIVSFANVDNWSQTLVRALIIIIALAGPGLVQLTRRSGIFARPGRRGATEVRKVEP
jgi:ribose transport system permease protein